MLDSTQSLENTVRIILGIVFVLWWLLYLGQLVSVVNLPLAQRLGLQEKPGSVDSLVTRLELGTARWDLVSLWVLPMAGILMLIDHGWWPVFALVGGGIFVDAGGREAVKLSALRQHGVPIGTPKELRLAMVVYAVLVIVGGLGIGAGLVEISTPPPT
jgi:hypothetical protein